jgi:peroxiredoxin
MKKIIYFFLAILIIGCNQSLDKNTYHLEYIHQTNEPIYIFKIDNNNPVKIDSSVSTSGKHKFDIKLKGADIFLVGSQPQKSILFIGVPNKSNQFLFQEGDYSKLKVNGDSINIILQDHFKYRNGIISEIQKINNLKDQEKIILKNNILVKYQEYLKKFINQNQQSPSIIMVLGEIQNPVEFMNELLLIKKVIINQFENQKYLTDINNAIENANQQKKFLAQQEDRAIQELDQRKKLGLEIGARAPEIALSDVNGKIIKLSSLKGNVVLIDFWASWCRPCRAENPNVVKLYNKYKNKDFTIYSISLDQDRKKWIDAINQDQLSWPNHVSELTGWKSTPGIQYGVSSIPKTFLIDKDGIIIGYDLRGSNLEKKLSELL